MSDTPAEAAPKKKGGKLPIIIALAAVLGGGGFFMMQGKGDAKKKKEVPVLELAESEHDLEEFLTNTANPSVYVRTKIAVTLRKDMDPHHFEAAIGDVRDAALMVLNASDPSFLSDATRRPELKKKLAEAMNAALHAQEHHEEGEDDKEHAKSRRRGKVTEKENPAAKDGHSDDWDSDTGPILKVRFKSLATQ